MAVAAADLFPPRNVPQFGALEYGPSRIVTLDRNIAAVQQAVEREAAQAPFDLLATLAVAVEATPPPATLIVISSGLSTAGGFDLRQVGWDAIPRIVTAQLKTRGLLPGLAGYRVIFSGLGNTAGRQPALPQPQQTTLIRYWLAICQAADATSCSTDTSSRAQSASHSTARLREIPGMQRVAVVRAVPQLTIAAALHDRGADQGSTGRFRRRGLVRAARDRSRPGPLPGRSGDGDVPFRWFSGPLFGTDATVITWLAAKSRPRGWRSNR